ncbi:hypothetical protein BDM02DRAFT_3123619 [Thelephora ganbajun]|uniref:Uncharacterized protein n=1 Tax=Thelephora ganbajun TaxID=370292 RepID=A0ACB6Z1H0_THEGA|nr:hypothetical protein BDM02DRAFT_3123619 [Thelephora ganbajun]
MCLVSTVLLVFFSLVLAVRFSTTWFFPLTSRPHCAAYQYLLVSSVVVSPLYHLVSLHHAKGFASQAPKIYIIHPHPRHLIVKFTYLVRCIAYAFFSLTQL